MLWSVDLILDLEVIMIRTSQIYLLGVGKRSWVPWRSNNSAGANALKRKSRWHHHQQQLQEQYCNLRDNTSVSNRKRPNCILDILSYSVNPWAPDIYYIVYTCSPTITRHEPSWEITTQQFQPLSAVQMQLPGTPAVAPSLKRGTWRAWAHGSGRWMMDDGLPYSLILVDEGKSWWRMMVHDYS